MLAIGQPSHAWISGQLARAWGNGRFGAVAPAEEVCLAAEQHDIGMAAWDLAPTRNPNTGLPYSFTQMPLAVHLELWTEGPRRLVRQSRYAALLASMHGFRLYEHRDLSSLDREDADAIRSFRAGQRRFQDELLGWLRADPAAAPFAGPESVARNSQLLWTWDFLSLALCLDWAPCRALQVPTADESVDLELRPGRGPDQAAGPLTLDPWPFTHPTVTVRCEGQRLSGRFETDEELRQALATAAWETVEFTLAG